MYFARCEGLAFFVYGAAETAHLKARDKRLSEAIDAIGDIRRRVEPDLFTALVHSIVGQQISTKALETVWGRMAAAFGRVTPGAVLARPVDELQAFGISFRKAGYIRGAAEAIATGALNLDAVARMPDDEAIRALSSLDGVGVWTAEMLLLFSLQRPDVFSFGDLAIHRGLRALYRHKEIPRERFERYRRRFAPYGSVASLYLWAVAGGGLEGKECQGAPPPGPPPGG